MKNDIDEKIGRMLKDNGLYLTRHRVSILKLLYKATSPLSQHQIAIRSEENNIDKTTVYRTLENLVKSGLVHKAFISKRASYYELSHHCSKDQCHPHFTCINCGNTHCLTEMSLPMAKSPYKGFIITRQKVQFEGLCPVCS